MLDCCRHCGRKRVYRPRGLCWSFYENLDVRSQYEPLNKYGKRGRRGHDARNGAYLSAEPTEDLPGTEGKVQTMEERAARGEGLFHPRDRARSE